MEEAASNAVRQCPAIQIQSPGMPRRTGPNRQTQTRGIDLQVQTIAARGIIATGGDGLRKDPEDAKRADLGYRPFAGTLPRPAGR